MMYIYIYIYIYRERERERERERDIFFFLGVGLVREFMVLQDYFPYFELSQSLGWAKSKDPCGKKITPDHLHLPYILYKSLKFRRTRWLCHRVMRSEDADMMANSVDPDQTAPLGAV